MLLDIETDETAFILAWCKRVIYISEQIQALEKEHKLYKERMTSGSNREAVCNHQVNTDPQ